MIRGHRFITTTALSTLISMAGCLGQLTTSEKSPEGGGELLSLTPPADGAGTASISPAGPVTVGSFDTYTITYEAGSGGIATDGQVRFTIPGLWIQPRPLGSKTLGAVTAATSAAATTVALDITNNRPDPGEPAVDTLADQVTVTVVSGGLDAGDTLTLTYGDTSTGGQGARAPFWVRTSFPFTVETDADNDGTFEPLAASPEVVVEPGEPSRLRVLVRPSLVSDGDEVRLQVQVLDEYGNLTTGYSGDLDVALAAESTGGADVAAKVALSSTDSSAKLQAEVDAVGDLWFDVSDPSGQLAGDQSNPVMVRPAVGAEEGARTTYGPPSNLHALWGDLHAHSDVSGWIENCSPEDTIKFMINTAGLDFGALTDYAGTLSTADWDETKAAINDYNCEEPVDEVNDCEDERHFVTILGYERNDVYNPNGHYHGHRNLYFFQDNSGDIEYPDSSAGSNIIPYYTWASKHTPCDLWKVYDSHMPGGANAIAGFDFFTVPHHPAQANDFPYRHDWSMCPENCEAEDGDDDDFTDYDADYQPLVEVFSMHGNSMFSAGTSPSSSDMVFPDDDPIMCREDDTSSFVVQAAIDPDLFTGCDHKLGFIAAGDSHDGRPGAPYQEEWTFKKCPEDSAPRYSGGDWDFLWYKSPRKGLACVYSGGSSEEDAFHRGKIFSALKDRTVYGTTGARIGLWFEIEVNGGSDPDIYMGEEYTDTTDTYEAHVHGAKDGETIRRYRLMWYDPTPATIGWKVCYDSGPLVAHGFDAAIDLQTYGDECISTDSGTNIYYLVINQAMGRNDVFLVHDENKYIDFGVPSYSIDPYSAVLDVGSGVKPYTASALATEIASAMNTAYPGGSPFTASYSTGNHKFAIAHSGNVVFELWWYSGTHGFDLDHEPNPGERNNVARLLGFAYGEYDDDTGEYTYSSDYSIHSDGWSDRHMAWSSPIWIDK